MGRAKELSMVIRKKNNLSDLNKLQEIIKAQKKEIVRLKNIGEQLNATLDSIAGIHWWKDKEGVYRGCNDAMVKALGLSSKDDIIGKTDYELPWHNEADQLVQHDKIVMDTRIIQRGKEELVADKDGNLLTFMVAKAPLYDAKKNVIGTVGNSIDITETKKLEKDLLKAKETAEKMLEEKAQILRNMEHDIRTPFTGIYSVAEILEGLEEDPEKKNWILIIKSSAEELLNYCNKFIEYARVEDGLTSILVKKFDLEKLAENVIKMEMAAALVKKLSLDFQYPETAPKYFVGDPARIRKILMNLVGNSVKFTSKGYVKLTIKYVKNDSTGKKAIIQFIVEDTGIGIPPEYQNFIYEKMAKVNASNTNQYRGSTGLGLSMVKILVHDLDGQIEFHSELGKGTIFVCTLPLDLPLTDDVPLEEKAITHVSLAKSRSKNSK